MTRDPASAPASGPGERRRAMPPQPWEFSGPPPIYDDAGPLVAHYRCRPDKFPGLPSAWRVAVAFIIPVLGVGTFFTFMAWAGRTFALDGWQWFAVATPALALCFGAMALGMLTAIRPWDH